MLNLWKKLIKRECKWFLNLKKNKHPKSFILYLCWNRCKRLFILPFLKNLILKFNKLDFDSLLIYLLLLFIFIFNLFIFFDLVKLDFGILYSRFIIILIMLFIYCFFQCVFFLLRNFYNFKKFFFNKFYICLNLYLVWVNIKLVLIKFLRYIKRFIFFQKFYFFAKFLDIFINLFLESFIFIFYKFLNIFINGMQNKYLKDWLLSRFKFLLIFLFFFLLSLLYYFYFFLKLLLLFLLIIYIFFSLDMLINDFVLKYVSRKEFGGKFKMGFLPINGSNKIYIISKDEKNIFQVLLKSAHYKEYLCKDFYASTFYLDERFFLITDYSPFFSINLEDFYWYTPNYLYQDVGNGLELVYIMYYSYYLTIFINLSVKITSFIKNMEIYFKLYNVGSFIEFRKSTLLNFFEDFLINYCNTPDYLQKFLNGKNLYLISDKELQEVMVFLSKLYAYLIKLDTDFKSLENKFKNFRNHLADLEITNGQIFDFKLLIIHERDAYFFDFNVIKEIQIYINVNNNFINKKLNKKSIVFMRELFFEIRSDFINLDKKLFFSNDFGSKFSLTLYDNTWYFLLENLEENKVLDYKMVCNKGLYDSEEMLRCDKLKKIVGGYKKVYKISDY